MPVALAAAVRPIHPVLGMGLLALAVRQHDLLVYFAATATAGASYSLLFVGSLRLINVAAPPHLRGDVLLALYLVGYLSTGALALMLGAVPPSVGSGSPSIGAPQHRELSDARSRGSQA